MKVPEQYRLRNKSTLGSDSSYGNNGFFIIPHHRIANYYYYCMASDGMGWQHVSISIKFVKGKQWKESGRCPTWEEMCYIKSVFWNEEETVIQYHPAKSEYVNCHSNCLHLWKPDNIEIPLPASIMVGPKAHTPTQ